MSDCSNPEVLVKDIALVEDEDCSKLIVSQQTSHRVKCEENMPEHSSGLEPTNNEDIKCSSDYDQDVSESTIKSGTPESKRNTLSFPLKKSNRLSSTVHSFNNNQTFGIVQNDSVDSKSNSVDNADTKHSINERKISRKSVKKRDCQIDHESNEGGIFNRDVDSQASNVPINKSNRSKYASSNSGRSKRIRNQHCENLVSYNSTDDEQVLSGHKDVAHAKRKSKQMDCANSDNKMISDPEKTNKTKSSRSPSQSTMKIVKTTAKSTWDSSDSDFDASVANKKLDTDHQMAGNTGGHSHSKLSRESSTKYQKHRSSKYETENRDNKSCNPSDDDIRQSTGRSNVESRSRKSTKSTRHERYHKQSTNQRSSNREHSFSSEGSHNARRRKVSHGKKDNELQSRDRQRSRSRESSLHSSRSRSWYSSRTGSSQRYTHRRPRYRKSYSSRSSGRSSRSSRSTYVSRSRSSSDRTPRHRRHTKFFYRRRHRRRSYSSRSRSHTRVWRSSFSSASSRSRSFHSRYSHRHSSNNRSSSHRSRTPLYKATSSLIKDFDQYQTPPEHRLARLGVGPLIKEKSTENKTQSNSSFNSRSLVSMPSVTETVTAAVNRVVGLSKVSEPIPGTQSPNAATTKEAQINPVISRSPDPPVSSSSGVVESIPLPVDATQSPTSHDDLKVAPYIGPQVPPDVAKRYGLTMTSSKPSIQVATDPVVNATSTSNELLPSHNSGTTSVKAESTDHATTPEFVIPPEKVEHYRALQEQAKEHALRRSGLLRSENQNGLDTSIQQQQQQQQQQQLRQFNFLQQQFSQPQLQQQSYVLSSSAYPSTTIVPVYCSNAPILTQFSSVNTSGLTNSTNANNSTFPDNTAISQSFSTQDLLRQQQFGVFSYPQTSSFDPNFKNASIVNSSISNPMIVDQAQHNPFSLANASGSITISPSPIQTGLKIDANQVNAPVQNAQLQQLLATAVAIQNAQANNNLMQQISNNNNNNNIPVIQQQLLQHLMAQQSQLPGVNVAPNMLTASILAAQQQQQKQLLAQLQKQAIAIASVGGLNADQLRALQERRVPVVNQANAAINPLTLVSGLNLGNAINNNVGLPSGWPLNILRGNVPPVSVSIPLQKPQPSPVMAAIATAQQQNTGATHASPVSAQTQVLGTPQDVLCNNLQQRLVALQTVAALQQKQQQLATLSAAVSANNQQIAGNSFLQAQLAIAAAASQQQRQQLIQTQLQQQQQAALATILSAQAQQRQQQNK